MRAWVPLFLLAACGDNVDGNRAPIVGEMKLATLEDVPVTTMIDAVDNDVDDVLEARVIPQPHHGTVTIQNMSLTYAPAPHFHGNDRFTLVVSDGRDETSVDVRVSVGSLNDPPIGGPDSLATNEDTPRVVPASLLLQNDTDADGDPITLTAVGSATNGTVNLNNGTVTFAPSPNFKGGGSFRYEITDGQLTSDVLVSVVVGGVNDAPVANDDTVSTAEDTPITISSATLLANDTDTETPGGLTISAVSNLTNGTVQLNGGNPIFTPNANFTGPATFTYTAFDGIATDTAVVTVNVGSTNDAPVANNDTASTDEDQPVTIDVLSNDTDVDGPSLSVTSIPSQSGGTAVINGDNTVTFTPTANFAGPTATFDYVVSDGTLSDTGTVTITITPVNDPVTAVDDTATTPDTTPITLANLTANDTDVDIATQGQTLTVSGVSNPVNGTVVLNGGQPIFTPTTNAATDQIGEFDYTVTDGNGSSDTGHVTITITPTNDPPIAVDDTASTDEDTPITLSPASNDIDPELQTLTVQSVSNAVHGTATLNGNGTVTFTPDANFAGPATASFDYVVTDGTGTDTGTVTITINPVNDPVTAVDDVGFTTNEKTPITLTTLTANDTDVDIATQGQSLTVTAVSNAVNGTVALNGGQPIFTPTTNATANVTGSFDYTVSDGNGSTDVGNVTITITPVNDPPTAVADAVAQVDSPTSFAHAVFLANDNDGGDGGVLTITAVSNATNGSVALGASTITFTPTAPGPASFQYTISDGGAVTSTATVIINVVDCGNGVVEGPEACDDNNNTDGDGCSATCKVEAGFTCDTSNPTECSPICGDGLVRGTEECDDGPGNTNETDGCTTKCVAGVVCTPALFPPGVTATIVVDPATGHCYARIEDANRTFAEAETICESAGGHLATITSANENAVLTQVTLGPPALSWLGGVDDANDADQIALWVTDEAFTFNDWGPGEPAPGQGCIVNINLPDPIWAEAPCGLGQTQYVCEIEPEPCGDGVVQAAIGEECDDGNTTNGDGCSSRCTLEIELTLFTFTGAVGNEATFNANFANEIVLPVMSRGTGVTGSSNGDTFSSINWTTSATIDPTDFYSFTITPISGNTVTLTVFEFDERRSGTGIGRWALRSSVDGFSADLATFVVPDDVATRSHSIPLPATFTDLATVEFRIFGFQAEAGGGSWRIDNVSVTGSTAPLP